MSPQCNGEYVDQSLTSLRGIWCGADFGVGYYIWKSMIPTLLGNMVGGGLFVGTTYWFLYLTGEDNVNISFNLGGLDTAMEAGGPMRKGSGRSHNNGETLQGQDPHANAQQLPQSSGHLMSGIGMELSDSSPYTKSHSERTKGQNDDEEKVAGSG